MIVGVQEVGEGSDALGLAGVGAGVGPFLFQGPVEPFDLAVGLRPVGPGPLVGDVTQGLGEQVRTVGRPVIGQHPLHADPAAGEPGACAFPERAGGLLLLISQDLAVRQSGVVINGVVNERRARPWCPS